MRRILALAIVLIASGNLAAQDASTTRLRLFLDCATHCDGQYLRTEVALVDWVSDRTVADVHVIATSLSTGSGGTAVTLEFLGRGALEGLTDRVVFRTAPDATSDDFRREFARTLRLGLARYLLASGRGGDLVLGQSETDEDDVRTVSGADRWKNWIFTISASGSLDAESRESGRELDGEIYANRTTEDWKVRLGFNAEYNRSTFEFDDGEKFTAIRDSWDAEGFVARSVGPRWSVGFLGETGSDKTENFDFAVRAALAVEHDLFPYSEATRRRLIVLYSVGFTHLDYVEETIYSRLSETRPHHQVQVAYGTQQPWGEAYLNATAFTYLHNWARNRLSIGGGAGIRLARGLQFNFNASYSRVRDQITLPKGDATDEEILLELRELATGYRANINVGLSYTFGSFLNTVVNPRFNDFD